MEIIPLKAEHIHTAWQKPSPVTCYGFTVVEGDAVMGIAVIYPDEAGRRLVLVSYISDECRKLLNAGAGGARKMLIKACRQTIKLLRRWNLPVYAVADPNILQSRALLQHMGFTHYREETFTWTA